MTTTRRAEIERVVDRIGFVSVRKHPDLTRETARMASQGLLRRLHPGVYVAAHDTPGLQVRLRAAMAWAPRAVVMGRAAAKLTIWPELQVDEIELACPTKLMPQSGIRLMQRPIPAGMVDEDRGIRRTAMPLTVTDLIPELGTGIIVRGFRHGLTPQEILRVLDLDAHRRGHAHRRALLHDHRDNPWSEAEQSFHQLLRRAGITGWVANRRVDLGRNASKVFDVVFEDLPVIVEIDGYAFHHQERRETYERDRFAASALTAQGWRVIRVTPRQIADVPDWVIAVVQGTLLHAAEGR